MERYEMAEILSQKTGITLAEAKKALEENDWDLLDAMVALEQQQKTVRRSYTVDADDDRWYRADRRDDRRDDRYEEDWHKDRRGGRSRDDRREDRYRDEWERERVRARKGKDTSSLRGPVMTGFQHLWGYIRKLIQVILDHDFVIVRKGGQILSLPLLVLILLAIICFWFVLPVLVIGLFFGWQYSVERKDRAFSKKAMDKIDGAAERVRKTVQDSVQRARERAEDDDLDG